MSRTAWFIAANFTFSALLAVGLLLGSANGIHPLYLQLLFAMCISPVLDMSRFNDRYALLAIFSIVYFQFYGLVDFLNLFFGAKSAQVFDGLFTKTELVILVGGATVQIAYRVACGRTRRASTKASFDWSERTLIWTGVALFAVCTTLNWIDKVYIFINPDDATTERALASLSSFQLIVFMLAAMLQPLSILILAYVQAQYRRGYQLVLLLAAVFTQAIYGFVIDVKGELLLGGVLVILTRILTSGKLPRMWLISMAIFVPLAYPVLAANRVVQGEQGVNHANVARNLIAALKQSIARKEASTGSERSETFYERLSLKGSVDLIVTHVGVSVPYQNGYTLMPLWATFIPKVIWPNKPEVPTGQIMNKVFQVSSVEDTYISPSHLGELYWNFGWAGAIVGMTAIGLLLGYVGVVFDLSAAVTLTRLLVLGVTARLLILGAEGAIAPEYVTWLRTMAAIGLLHFFLAHHDAQQASITSVKQTNGPAPADPIVQPQFPNLMR